jgi:superfamily I DNA/RNA helicase
MSGFADLTPFDRLIAASRYRCPELLALHRPRAAGHVVQFYESDRFLIENISYLAANSLKAGDPSVLVGTRPHLDGIEERLIESGLDLARLQEAGRYVALDAAATLSQFLVDDWPDKAKFDEIVGGVVRRAIEKSANGFVFAFGEMVALLCFANRPAAAVRLEQLWNALAESFHFSLCCAYPLGSFGTKPDLNVVFQICAEHSLTIPAESPV